MIVHKSLIFIDNDYKRARLRPLTTSREAYADARSFSGSGRLQCPPLLRLQRRRALNRESRFQAANMLHTLHDSLISKALILSEGRSRWQVSWYVHSSQATTDYLLFSWIQVWR